MSKPRNSVKSAGKKDYISMPVMNPKAAGIDIGSRNHFVCVGQKPDSVKEFGHFTTDLHEIANYLKQQGIESVAMESTGYYWRSLFLLLQDYGFEVILVNARHIKNVKGHKTDVVDSRWIQLLHSLGLLKASFQLDALTQELRAYTRQRRYLLNNRSRYVNKLHKSLVQMNIQVGTVLSDIVGVSGRRIIEAIIGGQRSPSHLASLAHPRVRASKKTIIKSLEGTWRSECLFELEQSYELFQFYTQKIEACDKQIELLLQTEVAKRQQGSLDVEDGYQVPKKKSSVMTLLLM